MTDRSKLDDEERYYVYGLYDPAEKFPFYIGKGAKNSGRRNAHFRNHIKGSNPHKDNKIAKIERQNRKPYSKIIYNGLPEAKAYDKEYILIHFLDAQPKCSLTNICYNWGEGLGFGKNHPRYGQKQSDKTKDKISFANRGHKNSDLTKESGMEIKWLTQNTDCSYKSIGRYYGKSISLICQIKNNDTWEGVASKKPAFDWREKLESRTEASSKKLSLEEAGEIKWLANNTSRNQAKIGREYGVSRGLVYKIRDGECWQQAEPKRLKTKQRQTEKFFEI